MRWRPLFWLSVSMLCFIGAVYFWRLGDYWAAQKVAVPKNSSTNELNPQAHQTKPLTQVPAGAMRLLSQAGLSPASSGANGSNQPLPTAYRIGNTKASAGDLA